MGHLIGYNRPAFVGDGQMTKNQRVLIDVARKSQEAGLAKVAPGAIAGEVYDAAIAVFQKSGLAYKLRHRVGRTLGCSGSDGQNISEGATWKLLVGMVMTIEPGLYVDAKTDGARFGDTVLVTENGYESLTPFNLGR